MASKAALPTRLLSVAFGLALISALPACGVHRPLALDSVAAPDDLTRVQAVHLVVADKPDASHRFGNALANAFARKKVSRSNDAPFLVDYGLAQSAASTEIREKPRGETDGAPARSVAIARKSSPFDKCAAQRMRATLSLIDRASGAIRYRGEATIVDCAFTEDDERAMANALVADAMSQLGY